MSRVIGWSEEASGGLCICADALLGFPASFLWLQAEFQPRGDVIKGGVRVTCLHIIRLSDSAVANVKIKSSALVKYYFSGQDPGCWRC